MRRFSILILLLASTVSLHAASYEARSQQHAVTLDVTPMGAIDVRYDVKVSDVVTGELLTFSQLTTRHGQPAETEVQVRDLQIRIRVAEGTRLTARVEIVQGDEIIDTIEALWSTRPQKTITKLPDGVYRVEGDVKAPAIIHRVEPLYPDVALKARIQGIVIVEATISHDGVVKEVTVLKPLPFGLDQAAVDAVRQWTFKPGTLNGQPVDVRFNLTINFKLDKLVPQTPPPG